MRLVAVACRRIPSVAGRTKIGEGVLLVPGVGPRKRGSRAVVASTAFRPLGPALRTRVSHGEEADHQHRDQGDECDRRALAPGLAPRCRSLGGPPACRALPRWHAVATAKIAPNAPFAPTSRVAKAVWETRWVRRFLRDRARRDQCAVRIDCGCSRTLQQLAVANFERSRAKKSLDDWVSRRHVEPARACERERRWTMCPIERCVSGSSISCLVSHSHSSLLATG